MNNKTEIILELAEQVENFQFCSPSDDPDEQTAVIYGFKHLVKRFLGHARKIQNQDFQNALAQINPDIDDIYSGVGIQTIKAVYNPPVEE